LIVFLLLPGLTFATIHINSGTNIVMTENAELAIHGNWNNLNGIFTANNGKVTFSGASSDTILNPNGEVFDRLFIEKPNGVIYLKNNISITDTIKFIQGNLFTDSNQVILSEDAILSGESAAHYLIGTLSTTRLVGTDSCAFGNIGVELSSGDVDIGNVSVMRISGEAGRISSLDFSGIDRQWIITSENSPDERNLYLLWVSSDDNNKDMERAKAWHSNDGLNWLALSDSQIVSATDPRMIELHSITEFGKFTVSDTDNPLTVWHDLTGDLKIDLRDIQKIISNLNSGNLDEFDLNGDQNLDYDDVKLVIQQWGKD
jgi:hypothetical protein